MTARGYFGIGVEGISKPMNFGNLSRTAHGFGASFVFTLSAGKRFVLPSSDTTRSGDHMPVYEYGGLDDMHLPKGCRLVGVELTDEAVSLPSFRHPTQAAYVLGPENGSLSPALMEACAFVVKIPTSFCLNVATAGAIVMYDRQLSLGKFAERPVRAGGPVEDMKATRRHVHGKPSYSAGKRQAGRKGRDRTTRVGSRPDMQADNY